METLLAAEFCIKLGLRQTFLKGDALQVVNAVKSS